jgi:hypothetical protein
VTNNRGDAETATGTDSPPRRPAATTRYASNRYKREHDGHTDARRFPHRTETEPSGSPADEKVCSNTPVERSTTQRDPANNTGCAHRDGAAETA